MTAMMAFIHPALAWWMDCYMDYYMDYYTS